MDSDESRLTNPDSSPARFPPLARIPEPHSMSADPRQSQTGRIVGTMARAIESEMVVSGPNLVRGYRAASVDVGRLQELLEQGLARFSPEQQNARWDELRGWISQLVHAWVQRCKMLRVERHERGIHLELETQDDLGYYQYEFDVFPSRQR